MENFNKITIQEMSKEDMFTIINALEVAAEKTEVKEYKELKEDIMKQLCNLAGCNEDEFIAFLKS